VKSASSEDGVISVEVLQVKLSLAKPAAQSKSTPESGEQLDLSPEIVKAAQSCSGGCVRYRMFCDIANDPSFRTRLRLGYSQFLPLGKQGGVNVGWEDVFIGRTGLTVSGEYQAALIASVAAWGAEPALLCASGSYVNVAAVVGYRRPVLNGWR